MHKSITDLNPSPMGPLANPKAGYTLMEVMIATFLVVIIFAGGFGALLQGNKLI